jgi:sucrose-phosphate synthase
VVTSAEANTFPPGLPVGVVRYSASNVPEVVPLARLDRLEVVTRLIQDRRISPDYARPYEPLAGGLSIHRFPFGPRRYLRKELLWPFLDELVELLTARLSGQDRRPDWIHAHYADAGYVGVLLQQRVGVPLVFTAHSLGREKRRRLLSAGEDPLAIEARYHFRRRIAAEERALAHSALVVTSTHQELTGQYARYRCFNTSCGDIDPCVA